MGLRRVVPYTVDGLLDEGMHILRSRHEALVLISDQLNKEQSWVIAHGEYIPTSDASKRIREAMLRRSQGEPIAYIRGWVEWYGHRLRVSKDTLIPRPFSEHLVEIAIELSKKYHLTHAIDVGTGTGCIALSLAQTGLFSDILATDISPGALSIAHQNQASFSEGARVSFLHVDLLPERISSPSLILANLPYLPDGVDAVEMGYGATGEPTTALAGGPQGWETILRLIAHLDQRSWTGWLLLECERIAVETIIPMLSTRWFRHDSFEVSDGTASILVLERRDENDPR